MVNTQTFIQVSIHASIAAITLNRPEKRNAMHGKLVQEIISALHTLQHDHAVRVVILQGNGDHFCAGADLAGMQEMAQGKDQKNKEDAYLLAELMYQLYTFPKPTIALAHGTTLGGGLGLLSACDIAIAAHNAIFSFSEVKIGITPSIISPYVIAAIGERAARYYFLTGTRFDSNEAKQMGLIHQLADAHGLSQAGLTLAASLLQNGPEALREAKQLIRQISGKKITPSLTKETAEHLAELRASPEAQEGLQAFLEKRLPHWS